MFLAKLYTFAGMHISGSKLKKFLKHNLPATATYVHATILHRVLKYGKIVKPADRVDGGWVFSRNSRAYTDIGFFLLLTAFYQRPYHLIMPSDQELARGAVPRMRLYGSDWTDPNAETRPALPLRQPEPRPEKRGIRSRSRSRKHSRAAAPPQ